MPRSTLKYPAKTALPARRRKNGRWMKQCATVFALHHTPIAITAAVGTVTTIAPWTTASTAMTASHSDGRSPREATERVLDGMSNPQSLYSISARTGA